MLAGGSAGDAEQFARNMSPAEYQLFWARIVGADSGSSG